MKVKIYYRSPMVWNIFLFCMFSIAFVFLQEVYVSLTTVTNKEVLVNLLKQSSVILYLTLIGFTSVCIFKLLKVSRFLFMFVVLSTFALTIINLDKEFSKIIIVMTFFYLVVAYNLYHFMLIEFDEAYYNPNFHTNNLFEPMVKKIKVNIKSNDGQLLGEGHLTNWSQEGCFVYMHEKVNLNKKLTLEINFGNKIFSQDCILSSKLSDKVGYGFKFVTSSNHNNDNLMNWNSFYEIIDQLGYKPELIR